MASTLKSLPCYTTECMRPPTHRAGFAHSSVYLQLKWRSTNFKVFRQLLGSCSARTEYSDILLLIIRTRNTSDIHSDSGLAGLTKLANIWCVLETIKV